MFFLFNKIGFIFKKIFSIIIGTEFLHYNGLIPDGKDKFRFRRAIALTFTTVIIISIPYYQLSGLLVSYVLVYYSSKNLPPENFTQIKNFLEMISNNINELILYLDIIGALILSTFYISNHLQERLATILEKKVIDKLDNQESNNKN
jgi:hypothetical protein